MTLQAVTADGTPTTNCPAAVEVRTFEPGPAAPVISEVYRFGSIVEVSNPGSEPVDVSGWELQAFADYPQHSYRSAPNARLRLPVGTVVSPGGVFTWSDQGQAPGTFPSFISGKAFVGAAYDGFYLLRLLDAGEQPVDEVYLIDYVNAVESALWKGLGVAASYATNRSYTRVGLANHFGAYGLGGGGAFGGDAEYRVGGAVGLCGVLRGNDAVQRRFNQWGLDRPGSAAVGEPEFGPAASGYWGWNLRGKRLVQYSGTADTHANRRGGPNQRAGSRRGTGRLRQGHHPDSSHKRPDGEFERERHERVPGGQ